MYGLMCEVVYFPTVTGYLYPWPKISLFREPYQCDPFILPFPRTTRLVSLGMMESAAEEKAKDLDLRLADNNFAHFGKKAEQKPRYRGTFYLELPDNLDRI